MRSGPWKLQIAGADTKMSVTGNAKQKGNAKAKNKGNANPKAKGKAKAKAKAGGDASAVAKSEAQPEKTTFPKLYNLADDIGESKDVAAANPDVVKRLQSLAEQMKDDLGLDGIGPGCRELGRVAKPEPLIHVDGTIRAGFQP